MEQLGAWTRLKVEDEAAAAAASLTCRALPLLFLSSSSPQQVPLSLHFSAFSASASPRLNNKKLFSAVCYLTAVLWIDGGARAHARQLLCTPNEFNHRARCQHVISRLCLPGERWNCSGWKSRRGRKRGGGVRKRRTEGRTEAARIERERLNVPETCE